MRLFFVTENIRLRCHYRQLEARYMERTRIETIGPDRISSSPSVNGVSAHDLCFDAAQSRVAPETLYFCTDRELREITEILREQSKGTILRVIQREMSDALLYKIGTPPRFGAPAADREATPLSVQLRGFTQGTSLRIAVLTPYEASIGDGLLFCALVRCLKHTIAMEGYAVTIQLFQKFLSREIAQLYEESGCFEEIHDLPAPLADLQRFDGYFDLSSRYGSDKVHWVDGLLELCGVAWTKIPNYLKRPQFNVAPSVGSYLQKVREELKGLDRPIVLFHPEASTPIRSIPPAKIGQLLTRLLCRLNGTIVTVVPIPFHNERLKDLSRMSVSIQHLAHLISMADIFLSVDTSIYHLAAALSVPGVVLFTTIASHLRLTYYPDMAAVDLAPPSGALSNIHFSADPEVLQETASWWDDAAIDRIVATFAEFAEVRARCEIRAGKS